MTNEQEKARELAKLLNAFADEKQLQYKNHNDCWKDWTMNITTQKICSTAERTRIKPETKRIALNQQDLIDRELSGKTVSVVYNKMVSHILRYSESKIYFDSSNVEDYEYLMDFTFLDNSPCYKEVECE